MELRLAARAAVTVAHECIAELERQNQTHTRVGIQRSTDAAPGADEGTP